MKDTNLKYYLRGLGIGVLVTALILGIAGNDGETMTDAQIRERALELGMVDADSLVLSELRETEPQLSEEPEEQTVETTEEQTTEVTEEQPTEEIAEPTVEETAEQDTETEAIPETETVETQETESAEEAAQETEESTTEETVTIEIRSGASSYTVSKDLEAAGLIGDAGDFDDYLCDNGYSRNIRVGTYEITVGTEEEEIAKIITGKR